MRTIICGGLMALTIMPVHAAGEKPLVRSDTLAANA